MNNAIYEINSMNEMISFIKMDENHVLVYSYNESNITKSYSRLNYLNKDIYESYFNLIKKHKSSNSVMNEFDAIYETRKNKGEQKKNKNKKKNNCNTQIENEDNNKNDKKPKLLKLVETVKDLCLGKLIISEYIDKEFNKPNNELYFITGSLVLLKSEIINETVTINNDINNNNLYIDFDLLMLFYILSDKEVFQSNVKISMTSKNYSKMDVYDGTEKNISNHVNIFDMNLYIDKMSVMSDKTSLTFTLHFYYNIIVRKYSKKCTKIIEYDDYLYKEFDFDKDLLDANDIKECLNLS